MIEQIQRVIISIAERVGTQGVAKESLGTPRVSDKIIYKDPQTGKSVIKKKPADYPK